MAQGKKLFVILTVWTLIALYRLPEGSRSNRLVGWVGGSDSIALTWRSPPGGAGDSR